MKDILCDIIFRIIGVVIGFMIAIAIININQYLFKNNELENTWAASVEFSQLESGQDRFSEHETNIDGTIVIVDHDTGIQYLSNENGVTALLEEDGTPKRVAEAG